MSQTCFFLGRKGFQLFISFQLPRLEAYDYLTPSRRAQQDLPITPPHLYQQRPSHFIAAASLTLHCRVLILRKGHCSYMGFHVGCCLTMQLYSLLLWIIQRSTLQSCMVIFSLEPLHHKTAKAAEACGEISVATFETSHALATSTLAPAASLDRSG